MLTDRCSVLVATYGGVEGFEVKVALITLAELPDYEEKLLEDESLYMSPVIYEVFHIPSSLAENAVGEGIAPEVNENQLLDYCVAEAGGKAALREDLMRRRAFLRVASSAIRRAAPGPSIRLPSIKRTEYDLTYLQRDLGMALQNAPEGSHLEITLVGETEVSRVRMSSQGMSYEEYN